ncbi:MAG: polymerase-associated protein RapA [Pseudomonadota bacterium]
MWLITHILWNAGPKQLMLRAHQPGEPSLLADRVRSQFQSSAVSLGDQLVATAGGQYEVNLDEESLTVEFSGSENIYTQLLLCEELPYGDHIHAYCSCLGRSKSKLCPHIWVAVRVADRREWCDEIRNLDAPLTVTTEFPSEDEDCYKDCDVVADSNLITDNDVIESDLADTSLEDIRGATQTSHELSASSWQKLLEGAKRDNQIHSRRFMQKPNADSAPKISQLIYLITPGTGVQSGSWQVRISERKMRVNGTWSKAKPLRLNTVTARQLSSKLDVEIARLLLKADSAEDGDYADGDYYSRYGRRYTSSPAGKDSFKVPLELQEVLLTQLSSTGRLYLEAPDADDLDTAPITYRRDGSWTFGLRVTESSENRGNWQINGEFFIGTQQLSLDSIKHILDRNLVVQSGEITELTALSASDWFWAKRLKTHGPIFIPARELDRFFEAYGNLNEAPMIQLATGSDWQSVFEAPIPRLSILGARHSPAAGYLGAQVSFNYSGRLVGRHEQRASWLDSAEKTLRQRCLGEETRFVDDLLAKPYITELPLTSGSRADISLSVASLPGLVSSLSDAGWHIEAEGRRMHRASEFKAVVSSGVNWFDLDAKAKFGSEEVALPRLLETLQSGERCVKLGDGSLGLLPEEWLAQFTAFAKLGAITDDAIRFKSTQGAILDALINQLPEVDMDAKFKTLRRRLKEATSYEAVAGPEEFRGTLRKYQEEGLGWLEFLRQSGFNGCLADDMGLGKTVQVLAHLQKHAQPARPSIIVVPRSLVHNWMREAERFCPGLRVLDYANADRHGRLGAIGSYDIIVTTYGLLRLDIDKLRKIEFHYAILDEAQAIKNKSSLSSKAARLLKARYRLALSGTPVENHLGELAAIFEFLNPGMLSTSMLSAINKMTGDEGKAAAAAVGRGLKPFILRRTKEQVLRDLPAKVEQTIYCDLEPGQRQLYDELLTHYRRSLSEKVKKQGLNRTKIQVLEALLRLRQAACHPGLIDNAHEGTVSGKIELLMEKLREVVDSGHKALVFSQFTSLLAIVRNKLDQEAIAYEYLDGHTNNREERVTRFQHDPATGIFLISLKAGGVGLNLTAADYCFILDPWWNPAVEAQAVARAHRIGQTKTVFAYRLIARDTIEDKILALQSKKRDLAQAIVTADDSVLGALSVEDLNMLLA